MATIAEVPFVFPAAQLWYLSSCCTRIIILICYYTKQVNHLTEFNSNTKSVIYIKGHLNYSYLYAPSKIVTRSSKGNTNHTARLNLHWSSIRNKLAGTNRRNISSPINIQWHKTFWLVQRLRRTHQTPAISLSKQKQGDGKGLSPHSSSWQIFRVRLI